MFPDYPYARHSTPQSPPKSPDACDDQKKKKKVYFLCYVRVRKRNAALFVPLLEKCANFSKNGWEDFQWSLLSVYAII